MDTTAIAWLITGNPAKAQSIGGIEVFTKIFLYYFHERIWQRVKWGKPTQALASTPTNTQTLKHSNTPSHIHPAFDQMLSRDEREGFLKQKSKVIWLTGLSGSGKSTIGQALERKLMENGHFAQMLDGDNIRSGINANLGFSLEDRQENIRRIAEVAKLYCHSGVITICTFISPTREIRQFAKDIIGPEDFIEIYVNAPLEVCEQRDVKGLYKKARKGEIKDFTGIDSPYEAPENPALELNTAEETLEASVEKLFNYLQPHIRN
jgi:adenylylsulfate kinase